MDIKQENNLVLKLCEYGISHDEFVLSRFFKENKLNQDEQDFINSVLCHQTGETNPNHVVTISMVHFQGLTEADLELFSKGDFRNRPARLLPNAIFNYIDHLEIIEARKAAKESKRLAWIAIWISVSIGVFSLIVGGLQLYFTLNPIGQ